MRSRSHARVIQAKVRASFRPVFDARRGMRIAGGELSSSAFRRVLRMDCLFCQSIARLPELLLLLLFLMLRAGKSCILRCSSGIESVMRLGQTGRSRLMILIGYARSLAIIL